MNIFDHPASSDGEETVYILLNRSFSGMVKIGRTDREVDERARELSSHTGVPTEFTLFKEFRVRDSIGIERAVHLRLKDYRVAENREFFSIEPEVAAEVIEEIIGQVRNVGRDSDREDQLLEQATAIAGERGKVWPGLIATVLKVSHVEAEHIVETLKGRGILNEHGRCTFSSGNYSVLSPVKSEATAAKDDSILQDRDYEFPPLQLLHEPVWNAPINEEEHRENAENLIRLLTENDIEVTLGEIHVGPVFARHEFEPSTTLRLEKLALVESKLSTELNLKGARILSTIAGKSVFGIEVQNRQPRPVEMREILESEAWVSAKGALPLALGKDVGGWPVVLDLARAPHILLVGSGGSGKTTCLHAIVASLLYSRSPRDVRFIFVDPGASDFMPFNTLPHGLMPVVDDPENLPAVLKWSLTELHQRFQIFAAVGASNLVSYNAGKRVTGDSVRSTEFELPERLPHVILFISELADAMRAVKGSDSESLIAELARHGGTAGIHLVIATQRPSGEVLSEQIKSALPVHIAFKTGSQLDSRAVLGTKGAESLIGSGDMFLAAPHLPRPVRVQGTFVRPEEIGRVCDLLKRNGPPQWIATEGYSPECANDDGDTFTEEDELFSRALEVLRSTRRASTSMIQRRLVIGYNAAARIMDIMEERGIVGPDNGSSPREILVDLDNYS